MSPVTRKKREKGEIGKDLVEPVEFPAWAGSQIRPRDDQPAGAASGEEAGALVIFFVLLVGIGVLGAVLLL